MRTVLPDDTLKNLPAEIDKVFRRVYFSLVKVRPFVEFRTALTYSGDFYAGVNEGYFSVLTREATYRGPNYKVEWFTEPESPSNYSLTLKVIHESKSGAEDLLRIHLNRGMDPAVESSALAQSLVRAEEALRTHIDGYIQSLVLNAPQAGSKRHLTVEPSENESRLRILHALVTTIDAASRALALNPRVSQPYLDRGQARSDLLDYEGALDDTSIALSIDNTLLEALRAKAKVSTLLRDPVGALKAYDDLIARTQGDPESLYSRALILLELVDCDSENCERYYRQAFDDLTASMNRATPGTIVHKLARSVLKGLQTKHRP